MKIMLVSIIVLLLSTATWAQCELSVELTDATCTHVDDACIGGPVTHGCQSTTFVAPCTQTYHLYADVTCTGGGNCKNCLAEAWVCNPNGTVIGCNHDNCGPGGNCASDAVNLALERGVTYTLYVCKLDCADYDLDCDDCSANCTARGKVTN